MSTKAHVVLQFGKNRIELYRHWGGDLEITGLDLLEKIVDAPQVKGRGHFHDGGYVLRHLLGESDGSLPQYQVVDGTTGHSWEYGYHLRFVQSEDRPEQTTVELGDENITFTNTEEISVESSCTGSWVIRYAELEGWETLDDWLPQAAAHSLDEFAKVVSKATDEAIRTGKITDYDVKNIFLSQFKRGDSEG